MPECRMIKSLKKIVSLKGATGIGGQDRPCARSAAVPAASSGGVSPPVATPSQDSQSCSVVLSRAWSPSNNCFSEIPTDRKTEPSPPKIIHLKPKSHPSNSESKCIKVDKGGEGGFFDVRRSAFDVRCSLLLLRTSCASGKSFLNCHLHRAHSVLNCKTKPL